MLHFYQRLINVKVDSQNKYINVKVLLKATETYTHNDAYYFFLHALNHR